MLIPNRVRRFVGILAFLVVVGLAAWASVEVSRSEQRREQARSHTLESLVEENRSLRSAVGQLIEQVEALGAQPVVTAPPAILMPAPRPTRPTRPATRPPAQSSPAPTSRLATPAPTPVPTPVPTPTPTPSPACVHPLVPTPPTCPLKAN